MICLFSWLLCLFHPYIPWTFMECFYYNMFVPQLECLTHVWMTNDEPDSEIHNTPVNKLRPTTNRSAQTFDPLTCNKPSVCPLRTSCLPAMLIMWFHVSGPPTFQGEHWNAGNGPGNKASICYYYCVYACFDELVLVMLCVNHKSATIWWIAIIIMLLTIYGLVWALATTLEMP